MMETPEDGTRDHRACDVVRATWSTSKMYRLLVVVALILAGVRSLVQVYYFGMLLFPHHPLFGGIPEWAGNEEGMVPPDLQIYLTAAEHFKNRERLYLQGSLAVLEEHYPYAPAFAFAFIPNTWLSPLVVTAGHTLLHLVLYVLLFLRWDRMFARWGMARARIMLAWSLPVWIVYAAFWQELGYLNIYIPMVLVGTLFIEAVVNERLGWAIFWLSIIVQIKPHWTFAVVVPLLLGRYRFFVRMVGWAALVYVGVALTLAVVAGPAYIAQQYVEYVEFLRCLSRDFPWRGPDMPFMGYNHSVRQIVYYWLGISPTTQLIGTLVKLVLLLPLALVSVRAMLRPDGRPGHAVPYRALDLAFAFYLGAFIWLDMVWEVGLSIAIVPYLLATTKQKGWRALVWTVFLPYALVDQWQLAGFLVWGMDAIAPGPYILFDYSIYVPSRMVLIVVLYAMLVTHLLRRPAERPAGTSAEPRLAIS